MIATSLTQIKAADGARTPDGCRTGLLSTVAFGLWAAAGICLAPGDAMAGGATAVDSTTLLSPLCAAADLRFMTLIEAHGEAQDVAAETLARAFLVVLEARKACNEGQVEAGIKLYESIPLRPGMSRGQ
jgi:hypothetical protein